MSLMTDLSRPDAFLNAEVICGPQFASAMLILHQVVSSNLKTAAKDHTQYQEWLIGQYLNEIQDSEKARARELARLEARYAALEKSILLLRREIKNHPIETDQTNYRDAIQRFYNWLYEVNMDAWVVIDPVVSVQPDIVYFEGFSLDESTYARVGLPQSELSHRKASVRGTTNIDFSAALANEFKRVRSYRPLSLQVGAEGVDVSTAAGQIFEHKIDLPDSWVRGFLQVQSAQGLPTRQVRLSARTISDVIGLLERRKDRESPRSLRFHLAPGQFPEIELDPWGDRVVERRHAYEGDSSKTIRIWGRRRLILLRDILPSADVIDVHLMGTGLPSFWSVNTGAVSLEIGLSGWTANDWGTKARFHEMAATGDVQEQTLTRVSAILKQSASTTARELAESQAIDRKTAANALQKLCESGKAMYDRSISAYRWRELFPPGVEAKTESNSESENWQRARRLVRSEAKTEAIEYAEDGDTRIEASFSDKKYVAKLALDPDSRMKEATCNCGYFHKHQLRQGPCEHLLAAAMILNRENAEAHD
jgi:hypothetical protein